MHRFRVRAWPSGGLNILHQRAAGAGLANLAAAQGGSAFNTPGTPDTTVWDTASSCSSGSTKQAGVCSYNYDYSLRVRWTDAPGTFSSVVTYSASQ